MSKAERGQIALPESISNHSGSSPLDLILPEPTLADPTSGGVGGASLSRQGDFLHWFTPQASAS